MPRRPDVSLVTTGHDVADARLHRIVAALLRAGLTLDLVGLGDATGGPDGVAATTHPRSGKAARAARAAVWPLRARGRVLLVVDPDAVPAAILWRSLSRGRATVVDVHEDYLALLADRSWAAGPLGRLARALAAGATGLARRADLTVVADDHVPPAWARQRLVVRNLPDLSYLPDPGPRVGPPRAVHVGDLRRSRGLQTMVEAVAATADWSLDLVGPMSPSEQGWFLPRVEKEDLAGRVRWHGRRPPRQAWEVASGAWAGLALLDPTPAFVAAVPTKLYEYLACGLAVVASPLPRMAAIVAASGAGCTALGTEGVSATLQAWSARPELVDRHRENALRWAAAELAGPSPYDELAARVALLAGARNDGGNPGDRPAPA